MRGREKYSKGGKWGTRGREAGARGWEVGVRGREAGVGDPPVHPYFIGLERFEPTKPAVRIDFGHEVIYSRFVSICVCPSEKQLDKLSNVKVVNNDRFLLTLSLLICGDVHPCPEPSQANSSLVPVVYPASLSSKNDSGPD